MHSSNEADFDKEWKQLNILGVAAVVLVLAVIAPATAYSYSYYSGNSIGSNGTVYGWGVTDGTPNPGYPMTHQAYVTTTLTSPKGRNIQYVNKYGINTVRADVSLPFQWDDLGIYVESSIHDAMCAVIGHFMNGLQSGASITLCPPPTSETSIPIRWDTDNPLYPGGLFDAHLNLNGYPTGSFANRWVTEALSGFKDGCYFQGSGYDEETCTDCSNPGTWQVDSTDKYHDLVGVSRDWINFYLTHTISNCDEHLTQAMWIDGCGGNPTKYDPGHTSGVYLEPGTQTVKAKRGNATQPRN